MKKYIVFAIVFFSLMMESQTFDIVPLGIYGGEEEDNLSSYLISKHNTNRFLALDAGTINAGIKKSIEKGTFSVSRDVVLKDYIKAYFISHGHLDHISGLIINSPADSKKNVYAIPFVQDIIKKHYFINDTWANFTDEGVAPIGKYTLKNLDTQSYTEIPETGLKIKAFELSHTKDYKSSAVLVNHNNQYVLYFGDTGADRIEESKDLEILWKGIAELIKKNSLKAILIEVSFPNNQPEKFLFGHLTPNLLNEEFSKLAKLASKEKMKNFKVIVTHRKPTGNNPEIIKKELLQNNSLELNYIFPVQGEKLSF